MKTLFTLKLNLLTFQRDLATASGAPKIDIIQHQKNIVKQAVEWRTYVQQAIDHHVMGPAELRIPQKTLELK